MQLGVLIGLLGMIAAVALFLMYFISGAVKTGDSEKIDPVPQNDFNTK